MASTLGRVPQPQRNVSAPGARTANVLTSCSGNTRIIRIGLDDRGTVAPGKLADLNVIDYDQLALGDPRVSADLPAGGRRLLQEATGYVATIKSGDITFSNGVDTGARPGVLVRGAR